MVISGSQGYNVSPKRDDVYAGATGMAAGPVMLNDPSSDQLGLPRDLA